MNPFSRRGLSQRKRALLASLLQKEGFDAAPLLKSRRQNAAFFTQSFAQQRLWFLDQWEPGSPVYNITRAFSLSGLLNSAALAHSINELLKRHEALRTIFAVVDRQPVQVIEPALEGILKIIDLTALPEAAKDRAIQQLARTEFRRPFDLAHGPLIRMQLLRHSQDEHILLLSVHHIVCDGWSLGILIRELSLLYQAYTTAQPSPLSPLPLQYADYALWQHEWLQGERLDKQLLYWKERLHNAPAVLDIPTDYARGAVQTFQGTHYRDMLPQELSAALVALSQRADATLFMTMLAAFAALLQRYSGQHDLVIGTPVANRQQSLLNDLIGCFVNTLALRINLPGTPNFVELLAHVKELCLDAYAHQDLPFERLVEALAAERDLSHLPLFQVMFALQNQPAEPLRLSEVAVEPSTLGDTGTARMDLMLTIVETPDGLQLDFEYNTNLFATATIGRLAAHFQQLLAGIVHNPQQPLAFQPLLSDDERQHMLVDWNATEQPVPAVAGIHQLVEAQVERTPDAIALISEEEYLTYHELNQRANRLAHYLRQLGVSSEIPVGLCLPRTPDLIVALLAVLKAGGAYVPLDPHYPQERLAFLLAEARVDLLLSDTAWLDQHSLPQVSCLRVDTLQLDQYSEANPQNLIHAENLAYVIYTSGSTGQPKGVGIAHRSTLALLNWAQGCFAPELLKGVLASTSICFDLSIFELFLPLSCGGTVLLLEDALQLPSMPAASAVTLLNTVPSVLATLLQAYRLPSSIHTVTLAGEPLPASLAQLLYEREGVQQVYNLYGPSEDTTYSTWGQIPVGTTDPVTIGRPIANTQAYVLDAQFQPIPCGVVGELYLGGAGLSRGYLKQAALTAERFIPDPFSHKPGARLYRTGDLVRLLSDGTLQFVGRVDGQVKLRGYRIELGEIEAILREQPQVRDAVVLLREDRPGDRRLVGYVVPEPQNVPTTHLLRAQLARKLPDYMLPGAFVLLKRLPLSPHGKLDRHALPAPALSEEVVLSQVTPQTPLEEMLADIWTAVLGLESLGIHDNFFALGGHSLLATQVVARLREALQREIPLRLLFEAPTVAQFAHHLEQALFREPLPPLHSVPHPVAIPLSSAQQRLWFIDQLEEATSAYNISMPLRIDGPCHISALEQAICAIVSRHEILRTTFLLHGNTPVQQVNAALSLNLPVVDVSAFPPPQQEALTHQMANAEALQPFDLQQGPLLRVSLLRLREDRHVLLLTLHHIIVDGWSLGIFLRELAALYQGFVLDQPSTLPQLPIQYADYALWQQNLLQSDTLAAQLAYWKRQLQDAPLRLELPVDKPRPVVQTFRGTHRRFALSPELTRALVVLSKREGATLFMTLLAAWQMLLSRYSGKEDVSVGIPIANRRQRETEALIGCFVNTLVLRAKLVGDSSFLVLLQQVREVTLEAYAHQDLPFEQLVEALHPQRDLSHTPLFQTMFVLQNAPVEQVEVPGLHLSPLPVEQEIARFELTLILQEQSQGLRGMLEYNTDLFEVSTIARMIEHYQRLLEAVVAAPDLPLARLSMLTPEEEQLLLHTWNATTTDFAQDRCLHELFAMQVERTPDAIALIWQDEQLSYQEVNERANRLAHRLRGYGVGPEVRVGVGVERSIAMVIGLLAILKAGGVYVPLDPTLPPERLSFLLTDAQVSLLLTQSRYLERWPQKQVQLLFFEGDERESGVDNPLSSVAPHHLAYMIYTSGSTGLPKGVMVTHQGLSNLVAAQVRTFNIQPGDRILQFASLNFDASIWEMIMALRVGATLCLTTPDTQIPGPALERLLQEQAITTMTLSPSSLAALPVAAFPALHTLITAGEACSAELVATWADGRRFFNAYGPTETTVCATVHECREQTGRPPIGRPLANTRVYVLDRHMQPVPAGVAGELYIGGQGVARGYLHRPDLTAERFVPDPFSHEAGARLYKTGDWTRYLPDGSLDFLGRQDQQIKLRGYRIELGEIEAVLLSHSNVREAVVIVHEDVTGDQQLLAYIVKHELHNLAVSELRAYLHTRLPDYMLPSAFLLLDALPLTHAGKIDRRALPAFDEKAQLQEEAYKAPASPTEELLATIWADVLRRERVGVHDHFFELGGHSLLATQVIARIREAWQVELPLRALFEAPTIAALAERLELAMQAGQSLEIPPLHPYPQTPHMPLSYAQQRLWFLDQLEPGSVLYNAPLAFRLQDELNYAALEKSMQAMVARHTALRTIFPTHEGQPVQHIQPALMFSLPLVDLSAMREPKQAARRLISQEAATPFDLRNGPLLRGWVLRLSKREHLLLLNMHHIVSDGWSLGILQLELSSLYSGFVTEQPAALPALPIQYVDYALWQREWLRGEVLQRHLAYWREHLTGAPELLELPTDRPRRSQPDFTGRVLPFQIEWSLVQRLKELSREHGATLFMTLFAAFALLLWRVSGQDDVLVGTPIANRRKRETEALIGFFVNTLVLRAQIQAEMSVESFLEGIREMILRAYAHQDVPFEQVVEALHPQRSTGHTPLFQVLFILQNAPREEMILPGLQVSSQPIEQTSAKQELTLFLQETAHGLRGMLEYQTALFEEETIARLVGAYQRIVEGMVADAQQPLYRLPWLSEKEKEQLLAEWNATGARRASERGLHELFEQQVERTPDAIALVCEDEQITYAHLNARANQLARYLLSLNVRSEDVVALCLSRSIAMVVGLLAVLKAGGAYLLLDPTNPQERLAYIIGDAHAALLLTEPQVMRSEAVDVPVVYLDRHDIFTDLPESNPQLTSLPDHLAYVIYTSGSTGKPKGIQSTQRGLINLVNWHQKACALSSSDRASHLAGLGFDAASWELWPYLASGASISLVDDRIRVWPKQLQKWMLQQAITISFVPTPLAEQLATLPWPRDAALRMMLVGGDRLHQIPVAALPFTVINHYGPSEYTVVATSGQVVQEQQEHLLPSIGRPIANTQVYVLDRYLQPVQVGVAGELYLGGEGLARGYLNDVQLTAERFLPDPFSEQSGARLYRTGDVVRYRPDGSLDFIGRADQQVKLRGYRIELGEIEAVFQEYEEVQSCIVVMQEDDRHEKRLVAYVTEQQPLNLDHLRLWLRQRLPDYMIPTAIVALAQLPLSANGKVDRRALPALQPGQFQREEIYVAPASPLEEVVAAAWKEVLQIDQIGRHDNFFDMGGHSLIATQVVARLRDVLQMEIPLRLFFDAPTVDGIARYIEQLSLSEALQLVPPLKPGQREDENDLPLSYAQQRLWFLDQLEPGSALYNAPLAFRLQGELNYAALKSSLQEVIARHTTLRTTFSTHEGQPVQRIQPTPMLHLPLVDLSGGSERIARHLIAQEAATPFDLLHGPLLRGYVLRFSQREHLLLLNMHHIVSDGWSLGVLQRELSSLYTSFVTNQPVTLLALPIQYIDYALWQRHWLRGEVLQRHLAYWREHLAGAPEVLELPTDHPRLSVPTYAGSYYPFQIEWSLLQKLKELSREHGATLFMTLFAAFALLLWRVSGQDDVLVGTPIANRRKRETEALIGFFVNTLVLRAQIQAEMSVESFLEGIREMILRAYAHQDVPFEQVVEALHPQRSTSHTPLFQVLFILQNAPREEMILPGLQVSSQPIEQTGSKQELTLRLQETAHGLQGMLEYQTALFEEETIIRMVGWYQRIVEGIVANPQQPLYRLPWLSERERHQLLSEWHRTGAVGELESGLHQLFEQQVERTPDAIALVFEEEQISYAHLNARANHMATLLRKRGIGPEALVGIYLPRSLDLVISVLGILKAGGAFFALDLDAPPQRLDALLDLARPALVVSNADLVASLPEQVRLHPERLFRCEQVRQTMPEQAPANPVVAFSPHHLAYLVFTSGSTGLPKGVLVPHIGAVAYISGIINCFQLRSDMTVLQNPPLTFDAAVRDILTTLFVGARLALMPTQDARDTGRILAHLHHHQVTHVLSLVPSFLRAWLDTAGSVSRPLLPSLRFLLVGGERLPLSLVAQARRVFNPHIEVTNHYGPTETTMSATFYRFPAHMSLTDQGRTDALSGRPFPNKEVYLLDRYGSPVPQSVAGEVYVGGPGVTRGYMGRPAETAERFVPHPFSHKPGERLYRTGDLARYRPDGTIEFLGRRDQQVKLRGYRVEMGEIEVVLRGHASVRDVVVMVREDQPGDQRLVAYIVPQEQQQPTASVLYDYARSRLPGALVPSAFQLLAAFPLLPNGKLDRGAFPVPDGNVMLREEGAVIARTATEELLVNIWKQVLHLERVGIYDHFFELGGHSLLATQVMARVNKTFQVKVPLSVFFLKPTIAGLAEALLQYEPRPGHIAAVARLRQKLATMSPNEVRAVLHTRQQKEQ